MTSTSVEKKVRGERKNKIRAVTIDDKTWDELKTISENTSLSMSGLIRIMIKEYKAALKHRGVLN
jgi:predicted DNA-binding ribbon-helix-helix protein